MRGQGPALVVVISGAALLLFGILASTDAGTVGGVVLGGMVIGAGAMLAVETWRDRRPTGDHLSDRSLHAIQRTQDRSEEVRAPRRADR